MMTTKTIIIIGGGAAGFFSAIHNAKSNPGARVIIIEKSSQVLSKVLISGGGRCNVTHACFEPKELVKGYPRGYRELLGPFYAFQPRDTMDWFEEHGVPLKIESDNRVFPVSDSSKSIADCLSAVAADLGIQVWKGCAVNFIAKSDSGFTVTLANEDVHHCEKLVLATGSSRQGYDFARQLGHTIKTPVPSLFTFAIKDEDLREMSGLSVAKTSVSFVGKKEVAQYGPLLITHWGMSGPAVIKLSAWKARTLSETSYKATIQVNWLAGHSLEDILLRFHKQQKKNTHKLLVTQSPFPEIPQRLWVYLVRKTGMLEPIIWDRCQPFQFDILIKELTQGLFEIDGKGVFKEEFVTCGGVDLKEVNFKTMESKICPGLFVVGETLDVDGVTGGFNFQNAWTTGMLSGQAI